MATYTITDMERNRREYRADLRRNGKLVGHVERGWRSGYHARGYTAHIDGKIVASGDTLADIRQELAEDDPVED